MMTKLYKSMIKTVQKKMKKQLRMIKVKVKVKMIGKFHNFGERMK